MEIVLDARPLRSLSEQAVQWRFPALHVYGCADGSSGADLIPEVECLKLLHLIDNFGQLEMVSYIADVVTTLLFDQFFSVSQWQHSSMLMHQRDFINLL